ncbi:hypothetical protein ACFE04_009531 [Oxalis oulophora]
MSIGGHSTRLPCGVIEKGGLVNDGASGTGGSVGAVSLEASAFRPNTGIEDTDNDVVSLVGIAPKTGIFGQVEELRRVSDVEVTDLVGEDGDDGLEGAEDGGLLGGGEAGEGVGVGVGDEGFVVVGFVGRKRVEERGVVVVVGGVKGWVSFVCLGDTVSFSIVNSVNLVAFLFFCVK